MKKELTGLLSEASTLSDKSLKWFKSMSGKHSGKVIKIALLLIFLKYLFDEE